MLPILHTQRLRLRPLQHTDAPHIREMGQSDEVMRYIPGAPRPATLDEAYAEIEMRLARSDDERGFWAVELLTTGEFIGWGVLALIEETQEPELGYRLREAYWGQGYATEIAICLRDYAFHRLALPCVAALTIPGNQASRRVLEKIGMVYQREGTFRTFLCTYYKLIVDSGD